MCHGTLGAAPAPAARSLQEEGFAFVWLRLTVALNGIVEAEPAVSGLQPAQRLAGTINQVRPEC